MTRPLRILMYHRVLDRTPGPGCNPSVISATPAAFREQMRYVARHYRVLAMDELLDTLDAGRALPRRSVLITFDDGCRDFGEVAWPILRGFRLPATVFVPTSYPDSPGRSFWWDRLHAAAGSTRLTELDTPCGRFALGDPRARRAALRALQRHVKTLGHGDAMRLVDELCATLGEEAPPPADVLGWNELRTLAADGVTIAPHTRTHPALTRLSPDEASAEIRQSAEDVRRELGRPSPRVFAYPFGDHDDRVAGLVRQSGFALALTCRDGLNWLPGDDPLRLRRTGITMRTTRLLFRGRMTTVGAYVDQWRHRERGDAQPGAPARPNQPAARRPLKVAYIMSRFPKLSETFVLNELTTCAAEGVPVEVYPLLRERQPTAHPEADEWVRRAHYHPFLSLPILRANVAWLGEQPGAYLRLLSEVLRKTWGSWNFLLGALGVFPKTALFARQMRDEGVTHVHAHFANHPALAAFIVHRLTGIPFSFTAHGSDLHVDRRMLDTKVAASAFTVTVSEFNREVIVRECGEQARSKVHVVHCGVNPEVFAPGSSRPGSDRFQLACVASFEGVKGHRFLVDACRLLKERGLPFDCHLVGEGPLRSDIARRVASSGLERDVHFHGGLPRPAVAALLRSADAAVLASHPTPQGKREGIPVALMEAMAAGLPVVASAISGIPELVQAGATGFLVRSGDPVALADALQRLAESPDLRARMGAAGRARVRQAFDLRANTLELLQLFSSHRAPTRPGEGRAAAARWRAEGGIA